MDRNQEGYPDPTAGKAVRAAGRMPNHVYEVYQTFNRGLNLLGFEMTGIRDIKTKKEWKK